jgi:hypothetical protein
MEKHESMLSFIVDVAKMGSPRERGTQDARIEIEIYPLQKGGLRTSFPRWGVTILWKEESMHVGPIVAPISTMSYIK